EDTADNNIVTFRFRNKDVKMLAAEDDFEILVDGGPRKLRAGSIIIPNFDRAKLEPQLQELCLSAWALIPGNGATVAEAISHVVKTHDLDIPRIGYIHSWTRTQDEG